MRARRALVLLGCAIAWPRVGEAQSDSDSYDVKAALRSTLVVSREPDDPALFPEGEDAIASWRFRLMADAAPTESLRFDAAYEQRVSLASATGSLAGFGVLPALGVAPYRLSQLEGAIVSRDGYQWSHELDRLSAEYKLGSLTLTAGRQAIGWGRGVMFSAVDLFAPFSPFEIDREWRRGIDAARAEVTFGPKLSADAVVAAGESVDSSAFVGRIRGYRGPADFELVGGWRARDLMVGATSSGTVGDGELHGELAVFRAPDALPAGGQFASRVAIKGLIGGSYRVAIGNGVLVVAEYHYSGFGAASAGEVLPLLANPAFAARFARGDTQILGRHALALVASYEVSPELQLALRWLQSPVDGSGVATPTATATLSERLAMLAAVFVPYGSAPTGTSLRSEYGATALSGFVQIQVSY
ncbi:MAG TPA: hypothetical protein VIV58_31110 [Kofleriaceae bacterium]